MSRDRNRRKRKRKQAQRNRVERAKARAAFPGGGRPTPIQGIERHRKQEISWLRARDDEFSKLLSRVAVVKREGDRLRGGLDLPTHARLAEHAAAALPELKDELRTVSDRITNLLKSGDPSFLVCWVTFWNTITFPGEYFEPTHEGLEAKVEFVSGLAAGLPHRPGLPPDPAAAQALLGLTDEAFQLSKSLLIAEAAIGSDPVVTEIRYRSRLYSLLVRGDAYARQGRALARRLFGPESEWMRRELGFSVEDVIDFERALTSVIEVRVNELITTIGLAMDEARRTVSDRDAPDAVRKLRSKMGKQALLETFFIDSLAKGVLTVMTFSADDITAVAGNLDAVTTSALLSVFTCSPDDHYWSPLQSSPLTEGPLLKVGDRYLAPAVGLFGRDISELLEKKVLTARPNFTKRRARVLDKLAVEHLGAALPGAQMCTSVFYPLDDGVEARYAECDGLVIWNDICLVLEGKGKALSRQSRRGDVRRIHADLELTLAEAWNQGNRVVRYIRSGASAPFFDERRREILTIDPSSISFIKVITPTLHSLADHALNLAKFADMGLDVEGPAPWAVYINDLEMICDIVRSPAELACYVRWRDRLGLGRRAMAADEADVFGAFLLRGQYQDLDGIVQIGSHSTDLDAYYMRDPETGRRTKPTMFSTPLIDRFIDRLVAQRPPRWLEAADTVLTLSLEQLAFVDRSVPVLARIASRRGEDATREMFGTTVVGVLPAGSHEPIEGLGSVPDHGAKVIASLDDEGEPEIVWATQRLKDSDSS